MPQLIQGWNSIFKSSNCDNTYNLHAYQNDQHLTLCKTCNEFYIQNHLYKHLLYKNSQLSLSRLEFLNLIHSIKLNGTTLQHILNLLPFQNILRLFLHYFLLHFPCILDEPSRIYPNDLMLLDILPFYPINNKTLLILTKFQ